ncbi:MAG: Hef nuclease, partial [Nanoarchaeota archaeon]|nr:Hef nuclease [Nanoarchaeota archaeon]
MKPIFDIFSKEKIKEGEKLKVVVDYREKNSLVISELVSLGFDVKLTPLKVADYLVKDVAIERKTVPDFISSMINKRLANQLEELNQY